MIWHIVLKFCIWLYFTVLQIKLECCRFLSIFVGVMPLLGFRILEIHRFMHFSPTCFDILSWNFSYDFVLLYNRSSLSVVNFRQFLWELCPFWTLEYSKYSFPLFFSYMLSHIELKFCIWLCLTILHIKFDCYKFASIFVGVMPLLGFIIYALFSYMLWHIELKFYIWLCFTVLQIKYECRQFPSIFVGVMPLLDLRILKLNSFPQFFSYMLWHIELKFCIWLCFTVLQIKFECRQFASIFVGVMPLLELRTLEIHSFPHFSPTCFDIFSWNFSYDFV